MGLLDELVQELDGKSEQERADLASKAGQIVTERWVPNPGPQTDAYFSMADVLLYGGEPGGGKSALLIGLAFNCHQNSLIMRRQYTDLGNLTDYAIKLNGSRQGFNGSMPPKLRFDHTKQIDFGAAAKVGDEQHFMGRPHDLIGIDEATQFLRRQLDFLINWMRSADPKQRTRMVLATNPPLTADGLWVHEMFAPWISPNFPRPADSGELRWVATDESGKDVWVDGPDPVRIGDRLVRPMSRTFIRSGVADNPFYGEDYKSILDNMKEPFRSILMGGFSNTFKDQDKQLIPSRWIHEAHERWLPRPPSGIPMCAMSIDPGGGGIDKVVLASRYDGYFPPLIAKEGKDAPTGSTQAALVLEHRRDNCTIIVDLGGGYGMDARGRLQDNLGPENHGKIKGYMGAGGANGRTADGAYGFLNMRSQTYWRFREALDPDQPGGSPIALDPDDAELVSDLTAPTFEITNLGIAVEPKKKVKEKIGRSPGRGDAVVMCWSTGPTYVTDGLGWAQSAEHGGFGLSRTPKVNSGRTFRTGRR